MNAIGLISCLLLIGSAAAASKHYKHPQRDLQQRIEINVGALEDLINKYINEIRAYDPLDVAEYVFNHEEHSAIFQNIHAESFSNIVPKVTADVGMFSTDIEISVSLAKASASVESWESNFPVAFGKGSAELDINNLQVSIKVEYSYFNGLQPATVVTSIGSVNAQITGIQNNADLSAEISNKIELYVTGIINSSEFHQMIQKIVDKILGGLLGL